jgi:hypothetical protein
MPTPLVVGLVCYTDVTYFVDAPSTPMALEEISTAITQEVMIASAGIIPPD